ncbi:uncharacterized protein BDR25DRAFT_356011 [Lindgomyces ingoldianus]|uniref:Uncharacterized protein n=1 Tax=Lindgomyces ingoldianus TaxID=673940 RepID=A0ACB6QRZ0_9PLEO|nr:uncharacterized protein BDR25DRAFT_356011 [Lindgomyces ingoldianus]KAF2469753.1 hypothetical protein BDR25DRAFT_356011 [Lindgomyces ingoldianus]
MGNLWISGSRLVGATILYSSRWHLISYVYPPQAATAREPLVGGKGHYFYITPCILALLSLSHKSAPQALLLISGVKPSWVLHHVPTFATHQEIFCCKARFVEPTFGTMTVPIITKTSPGPNTHNSLTSGFHSGLSFTIFKFIQTGFPHPTFSTRNHIHRIKWKSEMKRENMVAALLEVCTVSWLALAVLWPEIPDEWVTINGAPEQYQEMNRFKTSNLLLLHFFPSKEQMGRTWTTGDSYLLYLQLPLAYETTGYINPSYHASSTYPILDSVGEKNYPAKIQRVEVTDTRPYTTASPAWNKTCRIPMMLRPPPHIGEEIEVAKPVGLARHTVEQR